MGQARPRPIQAPRGVASLLFLLLLPLIAAHAGPSNHVLDSRHRKGLKRAQNPAGDAPPPANPSAPPSAA